MPGHVNVCPAAFVQCTVVLVCSLHPVHRAYLHPSTCICQADAVQHFEERPEEAASGLLTCQPSVSILKSSWHAVGCDSSLMIPRFRRPTWSSSFRATQRRRLPTSHPSSARQPFNVLIAAISCPAFRRPMLSSTSRTTQRRRRRLQPRARRQGRARMPLLLLRRRGSLLLRRRRPRLRRLLLPRSWRLLPRRRRRR